jgi:hypothetical protein
VRVIPGIPKLLSEFRPPERSDDRLMRDSLLRDTGARSELRAPLPSIFARSPRHRGFACLQRLRVEALGRLKCPVFLCGGCEVSEVCEVIPPAGTFGARGRGPNGGGATASAFGVTVDEAIGKLSPYGPEIERPATRARPTRRAYSTAAC